MTRSDQYPLRQDTLGEDTKLVTAKCQTTLLLDHLWMPIRVISAGRVFYYLFRDRITSLDMDYNPYRREDWIAQHGEFLTASEYPVLRSARDLWPVPTLAVVNRPFKRDRRISNRIGFEELLELYDHTCQICLRKYPRSAFDPKEIFNRDHILPRSKGGPDDDFNIVLACKGCNSKKGSIYPYFNVKGEEIKAKGRHRPVEVNVAVKGIRDEWKPFLWKTKAA